MLVVRISGIYGLTEEWADISTQLKDTEAYKRFLGPELAEVFDILITDATIEADDQTIDANVSMISGLIENINLKAGLQLETIPGGIYVTVDWPQGYSISK